MRWGRQWPERVRRPKVRSLAETEQASIVRSLEKGIAASPVLSAFGLEVRVARGRFYLERQRQDSGSDPTRRSGPESRHWPVPGRNWFWKNPTGKELGPRLPRDRPPSSSKPSLATPGERFTDWVSSTPAFVDWGKARKGCR